MAINEIINVEGNGQEEKASRAGMDLGGYVLGKGRVSERAMSISLFCKQTRTPISETYVMDKYLFFFTGQRFGTKSAVLALN